MLRRFLAAGTLACSAALISGCSLLNQQAAEPNPVQTKEVPAVVDEVVAALKPLEAGTTCRALRSSSTR